MKLRYISFILPLLFAACSTESSSDEPVGLRVGFDNATKSAAVAEAYVDSIPSASNPLEADIWFSTTKNTFVGKQEASVDYSSIDVHTKIIYYGPTITVPQPYDGEHFIHYPPSHGKVYCVGLYPQGKWIAAADGKSATAAIDGKTDLMYANQKEGSDDNSLSKTRQIYKHKLTWIKVRVYGRELATGDTWGKIKKISVKSESKAKISFDTDVVEYSDITDIIAYESEGEIIPTTSTEFGSILVSPTTNGKYTVGIECENHYKTGIEVSLTDNDGKPFTGNASGQVFVLTLYFQTLSSIDFTATLSNWEEEVRTLELKK